MTRARSARQAARLGPRACAPLLAAAAACALAAPAGAQSLQVSVAGGVPFPSRTLVLSAPGSPVNANSVHVTENGATVNGLTVTPLSQANAGDFGVVVVIDSDPSMGGAVMANALAAVRVLAAHRTGQQELGIIFAQGKNGTLALPLTSDPQAISGALTHGPRIGRHAHLLPAITLAVSELTSARIAAGAVIFVTDDIDPDPNLTPQSVAAAASAAHIPIYAIGVRDSAFTPRSMGLLAQSAGGQFFAADPSQVSGIFTRIDTALTSRYAVHYQSVQASGREIALGVRIDGIPGVVTTTYAAPSLVRPPTAAARHQRFWASSLSLGLVAGGCALLFGLALFVLLSRMAPQRGVTTRVEEFTALPGAAVSPHTTIIATAALGRTERALVARPWWPGFVEDVDVARMRRPALQLAYLAIIGSCAAVALLILTVGSPWVGIFGLFVGPMVVRAVVNFRVRKQRALFNDQLPSHLEEVAGAMRAGRGMVEALAVVADSAEEPTRGEFHRALADERLGRPLEETLSPIANRMVAEGIEQFAVVAAIHRGTGSSVAEVLDRVAEGARERADLKRELLGLTAQGRLSRWILTALPPVMLLAFTLIDPRYERPLFHTTGGLVALGIGSVLLVLGSLVMKRIVEIEV